MSQSDMYGCQKGTPCEICGGQWYPHKHSKGNNTPNYTDEVMEKFDKEFGVNKKDWLPKVHATAKSVKDFITEALDGQKQRILAAGPKDEQIGFDEFSHDEAAEGFNEANNRWREAIKGA